MDSKSFFFFFIVKMMFTYFCVDESEHEYNW